MNIPKLKKIKTTKNYHGIPLEDDYSWVDQPNTVSYTHLTLPTISDV